MTDLVKKHCKPCEGGIAPYNAEQIRELLEQLKGWIVEDGKLVKLYAFAFCAGILRVRLGGVCGMGEQAHGYKTASTS